VDADIIINDPGLKTLGFCLKDFLKPIWMGFVHVSKESGRLEDSIAHHYLPSLYKP
jgi:hypothetical protein